MSNNKAINCGQIDSLLYTVVSGSEIDGRKLKMYTPIKKKISATIDVNTLLRYWKFVIIPSVNRYCVVC